MNGDTVWRDLRAAAAVEAAELRASCPTPVATVPEVAAGPVSCGRCGAPVVRGEQLADLVLEQSARWSCTCCPAHGDIRVVMTVRAELVAPPQPRTILRHKLAGAAS